MNKKLKLEILRVKSFVITLKKEQSRGIRGGINGSFDPDGTDPGSICHCP